MPSHTQSDMKSDHTALLHLGGQATHNSSLPSLHLLPSSQPAAAAEPREHTEWSARGRSLPCIQVGGHPSTHRSIRICIAADPHPQALEGGASYFSSSIQVSNIQMTACDRNRTDRCYDRGNGAHLMIITPPPTLCAPCHIRLCAGMASLPPVITSSSISC